MIKFKADTKKKVKLVFLLLLMAAIFMVVVQNTAVVHARFLWLSADVPLVTLLLLTTAAGFLAGLLTVLIFKSGRTAKSPNKAVNENR